MTTKSISMHAVAFNIVLVPGRAQLAEAAVNLAHELLHILTLTMGPHAREDTGCLLDCRELHKAWHLRARTLSLLGAAARQAAPLTK
jgi:hypothetical protein